MARMARRFIVTTLGTAFLGLAVTGCVSQDKYNALKLDRDGLAEQLAKAQTDATSAQREADSYKNQLNLLTQNGGSRDGVVNNLTQQLSALQAQYDKLNSDYLAAMNRPVGLGSPLPPQLTNELSEFARQNPDLVDFDAARGIVKFKSDLTFASGDATVTPKAKEAIGRFSQILNSPSANGYELMVAGHTDNTRVANPNTIRAGHLDNWYLSAHRAITVSAELRNHAINPERIGVVGYADQRPVASNASEQGKAQNRRVEVLILPNTIRSNSFTGTASNNPTGTRSNNTPTHGSRMANKPKPNLNKDAATADTVQQLNK